MDKKVAIIGYGHVGKATEKVFPGAIIYDEPLNLGSRDDVNNCDAGVVCVPTNGLPDGSLDMSLVEEVVGWLETPLIVIKSALMPGTVDSLKQKFHKRVVVMVEMTGQGGYFIPFWKHPDPQDPLTHDFLIIGGEEKDANEAAELFWQKMSPDINIHLISAVEAEICKLMENAWGAAKVTFANTMYDICQAYRANYIKVLQAWGADGRVEKTHMRTVEGKRGWNSKCWNKDLPALLKAAQGKNCGASLIEAIIKANRGHISNES